MPIRILGLLLLWGIPTQAADYVLMVGGLGGTRSYSQEFCQTLLQADTLLTERHQYQSAHIRILLDDPNLAGDRVVQLSSLTNIRQTFARLRKQLKPDDTLLLLLLGHGQSDYQEPKFNLPGDDLSAAVFADLLDLLPPLDLRLILIFPCSGHFSELLSADGRIILASTDGARQIYHSALPAFLIEALAGDEADLDFDESVTFLELFDFLSERIADHYLSQNIQQTENPSLEDNGDGQVTIRKKGIGAGDGHNAVKRILCPAPHTQEKDHP